MLIKKGQYFKATSLISNEVEFTLPTNEERIAFEESGIKEEIQGSGDSKALMLILSAELAISSQMGSIQRNDSSGSSGQFSSVAEESDPSVFVPSLAALESLSEEEAAAAAEGMVRMWLECKIN